MSEVTFSGNTIGDKALWRNGVERGKNDERSRIIKLLEDEDCHCSADKDDSPCTKHYLLIALIKGENMAALRADRNSDIAQQEYADFSNPLIKGENK